MTYPHTIHVHAGRTGSHLQGIAVDRELGYLYLSFTTCLLKTDLDGNLLGSVEGIVGHLGCIAWNGHERRIYASLEFKQDAIGSGIFRNLGISGADIHDGFYMARFDADRITRPHMDAKTDSVMDAVFLRQVYDDYTAPGHRHGCSGIDGCTFTDSRTLYVAYGIYDDVTRRDNDHQILLRCDVSDWDTLAQPLDQYAMHISGPEQVEKCFVYTGNTEYGIQNLEYDAEQNALLAAVYPGRKKEFPNYSLFFIDAARREGEEMFLTDFAGHDDHRFCGSHFPYGSTGLCCLGEGLYYIGHDLYDGTERGARIELWRLNTEELTFDKVE